MPMDPTEFGSAKTTALLLIDLQNGLFAQHIDDERAQRMVTHSARLAYAARARGTAVVHCTKFDRPGFVGWSTNTPSWRARARRGDPPMLAGSTDVAPLAELGHDERDLVISRSRGASTLTGTELDPVLRNIGVGVLVLCGMSLNIAVVTTCTEAISLGYTVVVPTDAVIGFPHEYGESMLRHSFRSMATLTTTDELLAAWA